MGHVLWVRELVRIIRTQVTRGSRRGYIGLLHELVIKKNLFKIHIECIE